MEVLDAIFGRVSVRQFSEREITQEDMETILRAGMSGPSCANTRDWSFIVVRDKQQLGKMVDANGQCARPLRGASVGVLVCGDLDRAFPSAQEYWAVDGAIAAQNMILAARGLGIGSVWLGTWPQMERVQKQSELFGLPDSQIPHSIIAFGYPAGAQPAPKPDWESDRVHYEQW